MVAAETKEEAIEKAIEYGDCLYDYKTCWHEPIFAEKINLPFIK